MDFTKQIQKADEAVRRRNYDFAVELYRQLLDLDPDQGEARAGLRRALVKRQEKKGGGRLLRGVAGAVPMGRAKTMAKLGKHDACARALEDYLKTNPNDEEANLLLGHSLEAAGHLRSARAVFEFLSEIAPRNPEGLKCAGELARREGDVDRALELFERALAVDPRDQDAIRARKDLAAEVALKGGGLEQAAHSRERIVDQDEAARLERGRKRHLGADDLARERERLEGELAENASQPELWVALADVHEGLGDLDSAVDCVERASQYRRDSFELLTRAGKLKGKILKRDLASAREANDAGRVAELEGELAAFELDDARGRVQARPGDLALRLELGKRLLATGALDEALGELQACQNEPRLRAEASFQLGICFREKGVLDLAAKQLGQALEATPEGDERAKEILYTLGAIAEAEGDPTGARSYYVRVYEVDVAYRDVASKIEALRG